MAYYMQGDSVKIQYPQFFGKDQLNALIYNKVKEMGKNEDLLEGNGFTLDFQCAVTLYNNKMASVVFWGYSFVETAVHHYNDLISLNIDLATLQEVKLIDVYTINKDFENTFFEKAYFPTKPLTSYDVTLFSEMLLLQTDQYTATSPFSYPEGVQCFFKPEGVVLSMGAVHASGNDHFEAQLSYKDIEKFFKGNKKYWE